ncbi:HNH endonuclease signature motif containing protein [Mycolicibacterium goodii]
MYEAPLVEIAQFAALSDAELEAQARGWAQAEASASARKHAAMAEIFIRATDTPSTDERRWWFVDPEAAVGAQLGAAQGITAWAALHQAQRGVALRDRLPRVNEVFAAGLVSEMIVRNICWSTALMLDPDKLAAIDAELAAQITSWGRLTLKQIDNTIDDLILKHDPGSFRRGRASRRDRYFDIGSPTDAPGVLSVNGRLQAHLGNAYDARITELIEGVCPDDPRTLHELRHDALGAILDHTTLACECEDPDCARGREPSPRGHLVVHVIAREDTVTAAQHAAPAAPARTDDEPVVEPADDSGGDTAPDTPATADSAETECDTAPGSEPADTDTTTATDAPAALDSADSTAPATEDPDTECDTAPLTVAEFTEAANSTPAAYRAPDEDPLDRVPPAVLFGGAVLPAYALAEIINNATIRPLIHPGDTPPENRYTPSRALADYVRCRDLTCRFPGCDKPADRCDIDHTVPYPAGPTHASNLKCLCRFHHLLKTFWTGPRGWADRQHPDGTVVWTSPSGREYTTVPTSSRRLSITELAKPTGALNLPTTPVPTADPDLRAVNMPKRRRTRAQNTAHAIAAERKLNDDLVAEHNKPPPF